MTRIIEGRTQAWLPSHYGPDLLNRPAEEAVSRVTLYHTPTEEAKAEWRKMGYTYIGEATVRLEVVDERGIVDSKVASLRAQKVAVMAQAFAKSTLIDSQINQLLAIENNPSGDAA